SPGPRGARGRELQLAQLVGQGDQTRPHLFEQEFRSELEGWAAAVDGEYGAAVRRLEGNRDRVDVRLPFAEGAADADPAVFVERALDAVADGRPFQFLEFAHAFHDVVALAGRAHGQIGAAHRGG